ncbi:TPA: UDP-glucose 4-epimerase GalE [Enterobacter cloacae]|nr:UDP-glucose 4-epimerase GalE [Enterobacter pasteurii]
MNVLVTGGAGYIGSHTVIRLIEQNYNVTIIDNLSNSSFEALRRVEKITDSKISFHNIDIRDTDAVKEIIVNNEAEVVIHFAGLKSVSESIREPLLYYSNNVEGTLSLVRAMKNTSAKKLIFSSSATVYGEPKVIPLSESCAIGNTTNPYGTSKLMAEMILSDFCRSKYGLEVISLRYFNPVGAHSSGLIGEDPNSIPNNLVPYLTNVAIGKLDALRIYGTDYPTHDGTGVRDFIHVMDLAEGHLAAVNAPPKMDTYTAYNLGTGKGYSVLELIETFERVTNKRVKKIFAPRRNGDVAECWSDSRLALKELGWSAKYTLEDMLEDSWRWQVNNPNGYK